MILQETTERLCHTSDWEDILIPGGFVETGWQSGSEGKSLKKRSYSPPDYIVKQLQPTMGFSGKQILQ